MKAPHGFALGRLRCDQARPVARTAGGSWRRCGASEALLLRPASALFERLNAAPARCCACVTAWLENTFSSVPSSHGGGLWFAIYSACGASGLGSPVQAPTSDAWQGGCDISLSRRRRDIERRNQPPAGSQRKLRRALAVLACDVARRSPCALPSLPRCDGARAVPALAGGGKRGARDGVRFCGPWAVCPLSAIRSRRRA